MSDKLNKQNHNYTSVTLKSSAAHVQLHHHHHHQITAEIHTEHCRKPNRHTEQHQDTPSEPGPEPGSGFWSRQRREETEVTEF